jgi:hypothetical protein
MVTMIDRRTAILLLGVLTLVGCGTTNWTDTKRTATEQLLLSTALDDAVEGIDFGVLSGETAYLDTSYLEDTVDHEYLVGCLTERLRSQGCVLKDKPSDATYIVEARAGAVGTNRHKSIIGIPASHFTMPVGSKKGKSVNVPDLVLAPRDRAGVLAVGHSARVGEHERDDRSRHQLFRSRPRFSAVASGLGTAKPRATGRRSRGPVCDILTRP